MFKVLKYSFVFLIALLFFTGCKKYPKNTLLFRNPLKVVARGENNPWILEYYAVNNIDSTASNFLSAYKEKGLIILTDEGHEKYNCLEILVGSWEFFDKKKEISFKFSSASFLGFSPSYPVYSNQRNIFLESGLRWKIDKLTKKEFWIISELNNTKYEMHFK